MWESFPKWESFLEFLEFLGFKNSRTGDQSGGLVESSTYLSVGISNPLLPTSHVR